MNRLGKTLNLTGQEAKSLRAIMTFCVEARKGEYLHQPHGARTQDLTTICAKLGIDAATIYPCDDR